MGLRHGAAMDTSKDPCLDGAFAPLVRSYSISTELKQEHPQPAKWRGYFSGWRTGLAICTSASALVTIINLVFLAAIYPGLDKSNSEGALYTERCETAKQYSLWLHLAVNILGSVLLSASNYTQQVLTDPTRREVDRAHDDQRWLDIGVLSISNLPKISGIRVAAWAILALSSLPIHLFYNSVISFETGANNYWVYHGWWNDADQEYVIQGYQNLTLPLNGFERLGNRQCIAAYNRKIVSSRSDVILVLDLPQGHLPDRNRSVAHVNLVDPTVTAANWICEPDGKVKVDSPHMEATCDASSVDPNNWTVSKSIPSSSGDQTIPVPVQYCLSKLTPGHCKLVANMPLFGVVIACNISKLVGLSMTWLYLEERPLLTIGGLLFRPGNLRPEVANTFLDAIASFLETPDQATEGRYLLSKERSHP
ncbi:hypothetical protein ACJZ2D_013462 [Fusarium nematophilum]